MKKIPTVLLTFMMLAVLCAGCASGKTKQVDTPYVYPIQPGTEEWAKLDSLDAKIAACKVDAGTGDPLRMEYLQTLASYVADETWGPGFLKR